MVTVSRPMAVVADDSTHGRSESSFADTDEQRMQLISSSNTLGPPALHLEQGSPIQPPAGLWACAWSRSDEAEEESCEHMADLPLLVLSERCLTASIHAQCARPLFHLAERSSSVPVSIADASTQALAHSRT